LHKDLPYDILCHEVFFSLAFLDELSHVPVLTVFHDDKYLLLISMDNLFHILDDVGVV